MLFLRLAYKDTADSLFDAVLHVPSLGALILGEKPCSKQTYREAHMERNDMKPAATAM